MKIISKGNIVRETRYMRIFDEVDHPGCGWSFPVDEDGNLLEPKELIQARFDECLTGETDGRKLIDRGVKSWEHVHYEPPIIECDCGRELVLRNAMTNKCECGAFYNGLGQPLAHPRQWGEETGERFNDNGQPIL